MKLDRSGTWPDLRRTCAVALLIGAWALALPAQAGADRATLQRYAEATWPSFVAMTDTDRNPAFSPAQE